MVSIVTLRYFQLWETVSCTVSPAPSPDPIAVDSVVWLYMDAATSAVSRITAFPGGSNYQFEPSTISYSPTATGYIYPWLWYGGVPTAGGDPYSTVWRDSTLAVRCYPTQGGTNDTTCYRRFTPREDSALAFAMNYRRRASNDFTTDSARIMCDSAFAKYAQRKALDTAIFVGKFTGPHAAHTDSITKAVHIDAGFLGDIMLGNQAYMAEFNTRQVAASALLHEMFHVMDEYHPDTASNPYSVWPFSLLNVPSPNIATSSEPINTCVRWTG